MTRQEPRPATAVTTRAHRPALHDVTHLAPPGADAGDAGTAAVPDPVASIQQASAHPASAHQASLQAQVQQVEALLAAVRETVGSLAEASVRLEREVGQSLQTAQGRTPGSARPDRPSASHPAQAAVERAALLEAVENRAVIEQAKGMLMLKHRCDADSAFGLLVEISRRERRKVRDIAGDIVRSGTRPRRVVDVTDAAMSSGRVADQVRAR